MADAIIQGWLSQHIARAPQIAAGAVMRWAAGSGPRQVAVSPSSTAAAQPLFAAAQAAAERDGPLLAQLRMGSPAAAMRVVAFALRHEGVTLGSIALLLHDGAGTDADWARHVQHAAASLKPLLAPVRDNTLADVLKLQTHLTGSHRLPRCGVSLTSELASLLGVDRVSLGLLARGELQLTAMSHSTAGDERKTSLARALCAAMQEAIDQDRPIAFPQPAGAAPRIVQAHGALAAWGPGQVLTVPLVHAGHRIGALCFEGSVETAGPAWRRATDLARALAPLIGLKCRAEMPWPARIREGTRAVIARFGDVRRGTIALRLVAVAAVAALLTLVPVAHRIGAPARLEGAVQRSVAAPVDGFVQSVHVRPGDTVTSGELLVEMAPQDLLLEEHKWQAEAMQHDNAAAAALAVADRAQFAVARAKADEALAQLELVRGQLQRSRVAATIDGVVVGGDLTQSLGAPVQRGQVLLTLAPRDAYRLILEVDERDVAELRPGQRGELALAAMPSRHLAFQLTRITPVATATDGRNAFEVEAKLDEALPAMRPGLRGVAKIDAGTGSLLGIASRPAIDWLRLVFWR
ncbi:MAG TPA: HlyD family efflux transporter periplasmic adaptor subunit, partial [Burkholderiaceae bacterium]|nr:HlyD family efflux transporter periplasmic adaptor subunit [Burkholderiaceae bacterium]